MRFIQVKYADICRPTPKTKNEEKLTEFIRINVKAVEVQLNPNEYSSAYSAQTSLRQSIKRFGMPILAISRGGKVYLIRTDM